MSQSARTNKWRKKTKKEPTGHPEQAGATVARKKLSMERNLGQIQTRESLHLPMTSWGGKERDRGAERERRREGVERSTEGERGRERDK